MAYLRTNMQADGENNKVFAVYNDKKLHKYYEILKKASQSSLSVVYYCLVDKLKGIGYEKRDDSRGTSFCDSDCGNRCFRIWNDNAGEDIGCKSAATAESDKPAGCSAA